MAVRSFASIAEGWVFESQLRQTDVVKVVTTILMNARQQVCVSRDLGNDHYKRMSRVTEGVAV